MPFEAKQIDPSSELIDHISRQSFAYAIPSLAVDVAARAANESLVRIEYGDSKGFDNVGDVLDVFDTFISLKKIPIPEALLNEVDAVLEGASNPEFMSNLSAFIFELKEKLNSPECSKKERKAHLENMLSVSRLLNFLSKDEDRSLLDKPRCIPSVINIVNSVNEVNYQGNHEADLIIAKDIAAEIAIKSVRMPNDLSEFFSTFFQNAVNSGQGPTELKKLFRFLSENNKGEKIDVDWTDVTNNSTATMLISRLFCLSTGLDKARSLFESSEELSNGAELDSIISHIEDNSIYKNANQGITLNSQQSRLIAFINNTVNSSKQRRKSRFF
jgi:hypothetical protein